MNILKNKIVQGISVTVGGAVVLGIGAIILKPFQNQQKEYRDKIEYQQRQLDNFWDKEDMNDLYPKW